MVNTYLEGKCLRHCNAAILYKGWTPGGQGYLERTHGSEVVGCVREAPYIGCDEARINALLERQPAEPADKFCLNIIHVGTFYGGRHSPLSLVQAIRSIVEAGDCLPVSLTLCGDCPKEVSDYLVAWPQGYQYIKALGYVDQERVYRLVRAADLGLWVAADSSSDLEDHVPSKVFEYVYLGTFMLVMIREGCRVGVIDKHQLGVQGRVDDPEELEHILRELATRKQDGTLSRDFDRGVFSRRAFQDWFAQQW